MDTPSASSQQSSLSICGICEKQASQYSCQQCKTRFCNSPKCYESHRLQCIELVMKRNVLNRLCLVCPYNEAQQIMLDALKRLHGGTEILEEEGSESFPSVQGVEKMISGLEHTKLDVLCSKQRMRLERIIDPGMPWEPWWLSQTEEDIPRGPKDGLPSIAQLREGVELSPKPPNLQACLIDIIYSYCFIIRGHWDWQSDCFEAFIDMIIVSSVFGDGELPETVLDALSYCVNSTYITGSTDADEVRLYQQLLKDDVVSILNLGGAAIVPLLCDLQRMFEAMERYVKDEKMKTSEREDLVTRLKCAKKNISFLMCWANEQAKETWDCLALVVKGEENDDDDDDDDDD